MTRSAGRFDLDRLFDYHRPSGEAQTLHGETRQVLKELAGFLDRQLPEGREKSLAMTNLEQCGFWCHAAIARDETLHEEPG